jgi:NADH:ubiquinone oxidoreductase subunit B-like Fe-S oxidoreductase
MARQFTAITFATSCCGIEFMATMASHYDLARFGSERVSFSPRQADMLMVMGTISKKWHLLRQVYEQMSEPRWVIAVGGLCLGTTPTLLQELTIPFTYQVALKTGANRRWCNEITRIS